MKRHYQTKTLYIYIVLVSSAVSLTSCSTMFERTPREQTQSYREAYSGWRQEALHARDLLLGMEMNDVRSSWGEPGQVQVAGDPDRGDQRWLYYTSPSKRWGLQQARIVYFESGRVTGWETGLADN